MTDKPVIRINARNPNRFSRASKSNKIVPFAFGLVVGIALTNLLGFAMYFFGVVGVIVPSSPQVFREMDPNEITHRFSRLLGEASVDGDKLDANLADVFAISTIYLKVDKMENCHPSVVLAVSKAHRILLEFATVPESDHFRIVRQFNTEYRQVVALIKKHEPELARELANDVQTAVHFQ